MAKNNYDYGYVSLSFTFEGRRYYVKGKDEKDAQRKKTKKLASLMSGDVGISSSMTVKAWAETWLKTYINPKVRPEGKDKRRGTMTAKSASMYSQKINGHIIPALGNLRLKNVKDTHLQAFLNDNADMSFSHVSKLHMILRKMFRQAYVSRLINYDPTVALELPAAEKGGRRSITDYERKILLQVAEKSTDGLWIKFLLYTGLRPSESVALRVRHLDFTENLIEVVDSVESGTKAISMPKTEAGKRYVFISPLILDELKRHVEGKSADDFVFTQRDGKSMMTSTVVRKYWLSFVRRMDLAMGAETNNKGHIYDPSDLYPDGTPMFPEEDNPDVPRNGHRIAPDFVMYCLRHTYCTDLQRQGIPLETARYLMGHEDITTTANIYTHSDKIEAIEAAKTIQKNKKAEQEKAKSENPHRGKSVETA